MASPTFLPPSRALRWLREAGPRRRDTAAALRVLAAFGPAPAAFLRGFRRSAEGVSSPGLSVWCESALAVAARGGVRGVVLGDGLLDELLGEGRLLGVRPLVGRERGLHPHHVRWVVEVQLRYLLQAAGGALLDTDEAALAVGGADRVVAVLPRVAQHAHVRADDVAVVAAVADPAAHAPVGFGDRRLAAVGQGDLDLLAAAALARRGDGCLDPGCVAEVGGVETLVRHDLGFRLRLERLRGQQAVDVAGGALAVPERVHHHRRPAHDVPADEDVALDPPVLVGGDHAAVAEPLGQPGQLLDLADRDQDRVAGNLALGARHELGRHVAALVLSEPRVADHGPGDVSPLGQDPDNGGVRGEADPFIPRLRQVLWNDEQFLFRFERNDTGAATPQPDR